MNMRSKLYNIFKILFPIILVSIIILISYNAYKNTLPKIETKPINIIPNNASLILQVNNINTFKESLIKNELIGNLNSVNYINRFLEKTIILCNFLKTNNNYFNTNQLFISVHKSSKNKPSILYTLNFNKQNEDSYDYILKLFSNKIKTISSESNLYYCNESKNYYGIYDDIIFFSIDKKLILKVFETANNKSFNLFNNNSFISTYKSINNSSDINLIVNYNNLLALNNKILIDNPSLGYFFDWTSTDISLENNLILGNGFSTYEDTKINLVNTLHDQNANDINVLKVIPEKTNFLFALNFNNISLFNTAISKVLSQTNNFKKISDNKLKAFNQYGFDYNHFINEINDEIGLFNNSDDFINNDNFIFFRVKEKNNAISLIQPLITKSITYNNFSVNEIKDSNFTFNLFGDLFKCNSSFFTIIDDFMIFNNSQDELENLIDDYNLNNTLINKKEFNKLNSVISNSSNLYLYVRPKIAIPYIKTLFSIEDSMKINIDSLESIIGFGLYINTIENGSIHNFAILNDNQFSKAVNILWDYKPDTTISMNPQFINNHFTNTKLTLLQDDNNTLLAINDVGKVLWDFDLDNRILGEINYLDIYNNNKFQAVFNTNKFLYVIDRNGKLVNGFPKKLPHETNLGHSLFDYDKEKKYRIVIVGNNNYLYNLDKKGDIVDGWKYQKTTNPIIQKPIHFIVNNKDYILEATNNNTIRLLARNGSERVSFSDLPFFKTKFKISESGEIYSITEDNKLWIANVNGTSKSINVPVTNSKCVVQSYMNGFYLCDNEALIFIDINDNNKQNIQYLDSEIKNINLYRNYLIVTTKNKLYIFKNHDIIKGFPVDSDGYFNISDINYNEKPDLVNINKGVINNIELLN